MSFDILFCIQFTQILYVSHPRVIEEFESWELSLLNSEILSLLSSSNEENSSKQPRAGDL